jgi:hypothetical protein
VASEPVSRADGTTGSFAVVRSGLLPVPTEIWAGLGLRPRSFLDLVVTAPVAPVAQTGLTRPPEILDLTVADPAGPAAPARRPDRAGARAGVGSPGAERGEGVTRRRPVARITEGVPDGQASGQTG